MASRTKPTSTSATGSNPQRGTAIRLFTLPLAPTNQKPHQHRRCSAPDPSAAAAGGRKAAEGARPPERAAAGGRRGATCHRPALAPLSATRPGPVPAALWHPRGLRRTRAGAPRPIPPHLTSPHLTPGEPLTGRRPPPRRAPPPTAAPAQPAFEKRSPAELAAPAPPARPAHSRRPAANPSPPGPAVSAAIGQAPPAPGRAAPPPGCPRAAEAAGLRQPQPSQERLGPPRQRGDAGEELNRVNSGVQRPGLSTKSSPKRASEIN